jgi:hypothetical protein
MSMPLYLGTSFFSLGAKFHQNEKLFFQAATTPTQVFLKFLIKQFTKRAGFLDWGC